MRRTPGSLMALAMLLSAQPTIAGMAWNDCQGAAAPGVLTSPCVSNDGEQSLIVSFTVPSDVPDARAMSLEFEVESAADTLPAWWRFDQCRAGALEIRTRFVDPPHEAGLCADPWLGDEPITAFQFSPHPSSPRRGRLIVLIALPVGVSTTLEAHREYYACEIVIRNLRTTGPDACSGCGIGACIYPTLVRVESSSGTTFADSWDYASWQGATIYTSGVGCR